MARAADLLLLLAPLASLPFSRALDNGLGLTPPLGWRSYNAFGGTPTQAIMEAMMDAMVDRSRLVGGRPTSLLDLASNGGTIYSRPLWRKSHKENICVIAVVLGCGVRLGSLRTACWLGGFVCVLVTYWCTRAYFVCGFVSTLY